MLVDVPLPNVALSAPSKRGRGGACGGRWGRGRGGGAAASGCGLQPGPELAGVIRVTGGRGWPCFQYPALHGSAGTRTGERGTFRGREVAAIGTSINSDSDFTAALNAFSLYAV